MTVKQEQKLHSKNTLKNEEREYYLNHSNNECLLMMEYLDGSTWGVSKSYIRFSIKISQIKYFLF